MIYYHDVILIQIHGTKSERFLYVLSNYLKTPNFSRKTPNLYLKTPNWYLKTPNLT